MKSKRSSPKPIRSANTFAEVQPGVTVTATKKQADADAPVTISLAADADGIATKMQAKQLVEMAMKQAEMEAHALRARSDLDTWTVRKAELRAARGTANV